MSEYDLSPKGLKNRTRFAREDVGLCPFYGSTVKECNLFTRSFCSIGFLRNHLLSENTHGIMHHSILPSIISCTRSWNFAWHLLWRSTTESKYIVKLLAVSQTIHTVCCEDDYFPKEKFKLFNSLFHSVYLAFPKSLFSIENLFAMGYLWDVCNEDKCCVVTQRAADICVAWLVYVRTYCVPIASLNEKKRSGRRPNNKRKTDCGVVLRDVLGWQRGDKGLVSNIIVTFLHTLRLRPVCTILCKPTCKAPVLNMKESCSQGFVSQTIPVCFVQIIP